VPVCVSVCLPVCLAVWLSGCVCAQWCVCMSVSSQKLAHALYFAHLRISQKLRDAYYCTCAYQA
jgi:hypothetical protein